MPVELLTVDVDADDLELVVEAPDLLLRRKARADGQDHVGLAPEQVAGGHGDGQAMAAVDHALAHAAGHDRCVQHLGDACNVLACTLGAAADHDQRALSAAQKLGRALDCVLIDGAGVGLGRRRYELDRRLARPGVHGAFERHGTPPPGQQAAEGFVDQAGRRGGRVDAVGPLGEAAHDRELVGQFMQQPDIAADHGLLDLAGQRQHRRVHRIGRRQGRRGVEEARPRHDDVGGRLARRHGVAQRHVGAGLLVAGMDRLDGVGAVVQSVEERIVLHAGQTEDGVDAVHFEHRHDGLGGCQAGHGTLFHLPSYGQAFGPERAKRAGREGESLTGYQ
jgi:hypothetical protein